ncbi:pyruvate phosphate dikinase [Mycobacterium tuberculosis CAS/NITR204]|uniref:Pyruvate phosphate dikinase n=1 Tax=Mycobacterium tuberculosis CAS/NITR204 TaxID=1310114 RepID=R4MGM9_MYCTX|nr:pyruvate phosphate dikinase [Mycobacterium tuberculosis CAS/NITR204]
MTRITRANGCPDGTLENAVVALDGGANYPREILGNKGHGIDMMRRHHLPVPPAFCITTEVGVRYLAAPESTIAAIWDDVLDRMSWLETETSCTFGRGPNPLLVSVRSGATQSMPGMMDTILDVGMTDAVERVLARPGAADFAHDTRRRFTSMYRRIVGSAGPITDDPYAQLRASIEAVFASWNSPRAVAYRDHHGLDDQGGTAVVVQAMVFGNLTANSGAGVLSSRNPITGANEPFGEWLPGGQGARCPDWCRWHRSPPSQPAAGRLRPTDGGRPQFGAHGRRRPGDRIHRGGQPAVAAADPRGGTLGAGRRATGAATASRGTHRRHRDTAPGDSDAHRDFATAVAADGNTVGRTAFGQGPARLPGRGIRDRLHRGGRGAGRCGPGRAGHLGARSHQTGGRHGHACRARHCHRGGGCRQSCGGG